MGRTLGCSEHWEIITEDGEAELRHRNSGVRVSMDILQERRTTTAERQMQTKKKGKKENKDRKSSTRWNEIEFNKETGTRIMYWDLYCLK